MVLEQLEAAHQRSARARRDAHGSAPIDFLPAELHDHAYDRRPAAHRRFADYFGAVHGRPDERGRELTGTEKVLEVRHRSGYQTAVLARLARVVYSVEFNGASSRSRPRDSQLDGRQQRPIFDVPTVRMDGPRGSVLTSLMVVTGCEPGIACRCSIS